MVMGEQRVKVWLQHSLSVLKKKSYSSVHSNISYFNDTNLCVSECSAIRTRWSSSMHSFRR